MDDMASIEAELAEVMGEDSEDEDSSQPPNSEALLLQRQILQIQKMYLSRELSEGACSQERIAEL